MDYHALRKECRGDKMSKMAKNVCFSADLRGASLTLMVTTINPKYTYVRISINTPVPAISPKFQKGSNLGVEISSKFR